jgi:hypothetical protein
LFAKQNKEKIFQITSKLIEAFPFAPINDLVNCYSLLFENKKEELSTAATNLLRTKTLSNSWKNEFTCLMLLGNINLNTPSKSIPQLDLIEIQNIKSKNNINIKEAASVKNSEISQYNLNLENAQDSENYKTLKTVDNYIPAGSFAKAVLLSGVDAETGLSSSTDPE